MTDMVNTINLMHVRLSLFTQSRELNLGMTWLLAKRRGAARKSQQAAVDASPTARNAWRGACGRAR